MMFSTAKMPRRLASASFVLALSTTGALAQAGALGGTASSDRLYEALGMPALIAIMAEEGVDYGRELEASLFPGRGGAGWEASVSTIYGSHRMEAEIREGLAEELAGTEIGPILDFFESDLGLRTVEGEVAARRAMLDESVEEAASEIWTTLERQGGPRWDLLQEFADTNDLIEMNVAGAMTSNYAFYMGLIDGGAIGFEMSEEEVLSDVWSQEEEIRADTTDWVHSFGVLAYQPLSEDELRDYTAFTATPEGQALNAALFAAFNNLFATISNELGRNAARYLSGQDI